MALITKAPRGTQDFTPDQSARMRYIEDTLMRIAGLHGFGEIRTPTFEHTELFVRSVGDTTDVVQKEMYTFEDKKGRSITLKPEGTAGAVRAALERGLLAEALPLKLSYITPCFRYEKAQAGRYREFHQFGVELLGAQSSAADAEVIGLVQEALDTLGVEQIRLFINSIGCPNCRPKFQQALKDYYSAHYDELCPTCQDRLERNPMRILDCKSPICAGIAKDAPIILDYLCDDCRTHFEKLQEYLKALNIDFTINPKIVRGLDYYTKTVFEFVTTDIGAQGTVCGGGRYDGLIEQMGGKPTPAMGFAMGLERLILTMESQGCDFEEPKSCDLYIAPMDESAVPLTMQLGQQLRISGYQVEYDVMQRGLKAQMKYANKIGASFVMVLGGNELAEKKAKLKNMETGEQTEIALDETFEENFDDIAVQYMFHDIVEDFEKECQ